MHVNQTEGFQTAFRQWRQHRKLSQLELALAADVSQRHVSWLETGRSRPSRDMVLRLTEAMQLPLRERNALLQAAGFAAVYRETPLDEPSMQPVRDALLRVLTHHEPLPALVVDRRWNVRLRNDACEQLLGLVADPLALSAELGIGEHVNVALLTVHPQGFRPFISNWAQAAPAFVRRLQSEAIASGDAETEAFFQRLIAIAGPLEHPVPVNDGLLPVLPLELQINELKLSLFSVMSTFGTPQDITTDELRIEAFYPNDATTAAFFGGGKSS